MPIDSRTGRPIGDHGTPGQALEYSLDVVCGRNLGDDSEGMDFLRAWREGDLSEWPEFYSWLREQVPA